MIDAIAENFEKIIKMINVVNEKIIEIDINKNIEFKILLSLKTLIIMFLKLSTSLLISKIKLFEILMKISMLKMKYSKI